MIDPDTFKQAILALAEAYGTKPTETRVRVYRKALADLTTEQFTRACAAALRECRWFPTVAELRAHAESSGDDVGLLAWARLQDLASAVGAYGAVELDAPTGQALSDVFGSWPEFCAQEDGPQLATRRQEFLAAYRRARRLSVEGERTLGGWVEDGSLRLPKKAGDS